MERRTVSDPVANSRALSAAEIARREADNGLRQYDAALEIIEKSTKAGEPFVLLPALICELNRLAVQGVDPNPGVFRVAPITITNTSHMPPPAEEVATLVDQMCRYVNEGKDRSPIHLSAYLLWRLNWIHPFGNGNGRTSRVISYIILCVRLGFVLPGRTSIPEQIALDKQPYYSGLDDADAAWRAGIVDVTALEQMLERLLAVQLASVIDMANGQ